MAQSGDRSVPDTGLIFGLISDFMMKACDYKNAKREVLIHGVFSMWVIGAFNNYKE